MAAGKLKPNSVSMCHMPDSTHDGSYGCDPNLAHDIQVGSSLLVVDFFFLILRYKIVFV